MNEAMVKIITADISNLINIEEESLFELKVDYGVAFLEKRFPQNKDIVDALKAHAQFWKWWTELWAERDRKLLSMCTRRQYHIAYTFPIGREIKLAGGDSYVPTETMHITYSDVWDFYCKYHRPERVEFFPNLVLINTCLASLPTPLHEERGVTTK